MAYTDFTLEDLSLIFGVQNKVSTLFTSITPVKASTNLLQFLEETKELPIKSEKAKSELVVMPVLLDLRQRNNKFFTIYSGETLAADKEKGLTGECDFILAKDTSSFSINIPIIAVVEAKKNDLELGIAQCGAQLLGAKIFNEKRGLNLKDIYGCVTTADNWKFLKLSDKLLAIDKTTYYLKELELILGIFQQVVDSFKSVLEAPD